MKKENYISTNIKKSIFDGIRHIDENGNEYWEARELQKVLEYQDWRNFNQQKDDFIKVVNENVYE